MNQVMAQCDQVGKYEFQFVNVDTQRCTKTNPCFIFLFYLGNQFMENIHSADLVCVWLNGLARDGISFQLHLTDCCDFLLNIPGSDCYYAG